MAEINRKSVLLECLSIMREELRILSENYNGLTPMKGMEEAWEQGRRKVEILQELIHAYDNPTVRGAIAHWQMEVMENGPSAFDEEKEIMIPIKDEETTPFKVIQRKIDCPKCGTTLVIYTENTNCCSAYFEK